MAADNSDRHNELNRMADHDLLVQTALRVEAIERRLNGFVPNQCLRVQMQIRGLWATLALVLSTLGTLLGFLLKSGRL